MTIFFCLNSFDLKLTILPRFATFFIHSDSTPNGLTMSCFYSDKITGKVTFPGRWFKIQEGRGVGYPWENSSILKGTVWSSDIQIPPSGLIPLTCAMTGFDIIHPKLPPSKQSPSKFRGFGVCHCQRRRRWKEQEGWGWCVKGVVHSQAALITGIGRRGDDNHCLVIRDGGYNRAH